MSCTVQQWMDVQGQILRYSISTNFYAYMRAVHPEIADPNPFDWDHVKLWHTFLDLKKALQSVPLRTWERIVAAAIQAEHTL